MSDSYNDVNVCRGYWGKLASYIGFRIVGEGLWINSDPKIWFEAITDPYKVIHEESFIDTGGGPLHRHTVEIHQGYDYDYKKNPKPLFKCDLIHDWVWANPAFTKRAIDMYEYMQTYAKGKTWFKRACSYSKLDNKLWNELFGPLEKTDRLIDKDLTKPNWPDSKCIELLDTISELPEGEVSFNGEMAEKMEKCKQWALFALLDMERYYWGAC